MDIKKLNEQLEKYAVNEISDNLKASYFSKVKANADKANARVKNAMQSIAKSDARQISNLPQGTDKETAKEALEELKYLMKRVDEGSDWRLNQEDNTMILEVRYWGNWEGDDGSGDYDWQTLSDEYRLKLNDILKKVQKGYNIQIHEPGSEKNWLVFEIPITKLRKDSILDIDTELELDNLLKEINAKNIKKSKENELACVYFAIDLYQTDYYKPYLTEVDCGIYINPNDKTVVVDIDDIAITDKLDFNSLVEAFNYIKQIIKDRNEEIENQKKIKKVNREYAVWLDEKLLKEYPQIKRLNVINDHKVELKTSTETIILEKVDKRKTSVIKITKDNLNKTIKTDINSDFKQWITTALENI